jgi:hypothetical protein
MADAPDVGPGVVVRTERPGLDAPDLPGRPFRPVPLVSTIRINGKPFEL